MPGDEIALTEFIDDYLHKKWKKAHPNNGVECQCTLKPRSNFRNDINFNGYRKDNGEYEYHALIDPEAIIIVRTWRGSPLAIAIGLTVATDKINPLKWMGWEGPTLSSLDVTLINAIDHSEKTGKIQFKNKEIEIWS